MAIIGMLVAFAGAIGVIIWRFSTAATAARDIADAANDVSSLARRWSWFRRVNKHPLDTITDPREAATAMMAAIVQYDGHMTERERIAIIGCVSQTFDATAQQAEELLAQARFLVKDVVDPSNCFNRLAPLVEKQLGPNERRDLIAMLTQVAGADGNPSVAVTRSITNLERRLMG